MQPLCCSLAVPSLMTPSPGMTWGARKEDMLHLLFNELTNT